MAARLGQGTRAGLPPRADSKTAVKGYALPVTQKSRRHHTSVAKTQFLPSGSEQR